MNKHAMRSASRIIALALAVAVLASGCTSTPLAQGDDPSPSVDAIGAPASASASPSERPATAAPSHSPGSTPGPTAKPAKPTPFSGTAFMSLAGTDGTTGNIVLGGFVIGLVESGGTCTFAILRAASLVASRTTVGQSNSDNTSCGSVDIGRGEVPNGSYTATLTYENSSGRTTSEPMPLEVSS